MTKTKGVQLALLTALISGFSIFINKFAVGSITPPIAFTAIKNTLVGVMILSALLFSGKMSKLKDVSKKDKRSLVLIGLIGGALPFYLFFTGLSMIPAINAALIHKTLVLWVALLAVPFLKERMSRLQIVGMLMLFGSNLFIGGFKGFTFSVGELMVLGATLLWAVENVIAKRVLERVDADLVTFARMGLGSMILLGASSVVAPGSLTQAFSLDGTQLMWMVLTAGALLGYVSTWYRALKAAPATTVASVLVASTLVTNVLASMFITQTWKFAVLLPQAGLILTGLYLFWISARKQATVTA